MTAKMYGRFDGENLVEMRKMFPQEMDFENQKAELLWGKDGMTWREFSPAKMAAIEAVAHVNDGHADAVNLEEWREKWGHEYVKLKMPGNMTAGLCNFVQMAMNSLARGDFEEAMLKLIDLRSDILSGQYKVNGVGM